MGFVLDLVEIDDLRLRYKMVDMLKLQLEISLKDRLLDKVKQEVARNG